MKASRWNIYYADRELAATMGDPLLGTVTSDKSTTKEEAEQEGGMFGMRNASRIRKLQTGTKTSSAGSPNGVPGNLPQLVASPNAVVVSETK